MNRERILLMIGAVLNSVDGDDGDTLEWLTAAWREINARFDWHSANGRVKQALAWHEAADFFADRYDGQFQY